MRVSIIVFTLAAVSIFARQADACSCMPRVNAALGPNEVLFEATVESIEVVQPPPPPGEKVTPGSIYVGGRTHVVRLKDLKAMQGEPKDVVSTSAFGASCGYSFEVGERYQIHAYNHEGSLGVSICGMTRSLGKPADQECSTPALDRE
jgi:hypothetical protein